jgi:exopolysaccharide biosynthesis protein
MKRSNHKSIVIALIAILLSCILLYAGQFLFIKRPGDVNSTTETAGSHTSANDTVPVDYRHISTTISGNRQEIFLLEFDPLDRHIEFEPVLSYDNIFGYEKLADISKRTGAYAAVNAGFFYENGDPVGMVVSKGHMYMSSAGYDPVLVVDKNGARFQKIISVMSFPIKGKKIYINKMNRSGMYDDIIMYTPDYGSTNRAEKKNSSVRVEDNTVTALINNTDNEVPIKKNSTLISFFGASSVLPNKLGIKVGDKINIDTEPRIEGNYNAYECGGMLVKDGLPVVKTTDRWIGTLENRDPRTAVGVKENGRIVLLVADGRQPGYSSGLTGKELADYLISIGVKNAAMLDGGATSQIFVKGMLKNKPSYNGLERPVAGALIVKVNSDEHLNGLLNK